MYESIKRMNEIFENKITDIKIEIINKEYEAAKFILHGETCYFRKVKKTPKKAGYFVAMYKIENKNTPINYNDQINKLILYVLDGTNEGYFVFDKNTLLNNGILSFENKRGKMAFRVYPNWVNDLNSTAEKTKTWQMEHFFEIKK
ncbi:hypothetical protein CG001_02115 [Mesoplasma coleopterae]|uniref:MepB family protein n=1 Tax=Mesoplasma coleopterae TaxID=324078 RepID=UPI000D0437C9|nr:MepB family protein [Mesoplasma coleopterae]AVN62426.1 hypothetical protein CG001_02115 [Mesoplasma coleopterae]